MRCATLVAAGFAVLPMAVPAFADPGECQFAGEISNADQAIAACDRIIANAKAGGPSRAAAFSSRCGWRWAKQDDPDRALADCNQAIAIDSGRADAYVNRGNVYLRKGDVEHAFSDFNAAIQRDPRGAWAYSARGEVLKIKGDLSRAMADYSESIKLNPNYATAYRLRGGLYKSEGDLEHARADLNQALSLDPNDVSAYFIRGTVAYLVGDNSSALADFTASIRLDPNNAAAYFNRGVAYYVLGGHVPDAEADFRKTTELDPKDAYAAIWLELAARRNESGSRLREQAAQLDMTAWPAPVIRELLGESSAAQTIAAASDKDLKTASGRSCETNFYSGELALLANNKQTALQLLTRAANDCPRGYIEAPAALAEVIIQR